MSSAYESPDYVLDETSTPCFRVFAAVVSAALLFEIGMFAALILRGV